MDAAFKPSAGAKLNGKSSEEPAERSTLWRRLERGRAWLDVHPRFKLGYIVAVYCPLVIIFTVVKEAPTVLLTRKSFFLAVVYVAIRDSAGWLANLNTFFWYVQMNLVAKLRGSGELETAGVFVHYATVAAFLGGLVMMAVMMLAGRHLLEVTSPAYPEAVVDLGLVALYASAAGLPAVIMQSPITGSLLGMHEFVGSAAVISAWGVVFLAVASVMVTVMVPCDDKPTVVDATYVCPGSKHFLVSVSTVGSIIFWMAAIHLTGLQYHYGEKQGMYPAGLPRLSCSMRLSDNVAAALHSAWGVDTAGVAVRSILNNTRDFIALIVVLRLGVNAATLFTLYGSVSALSYSVPNLLSTAVMAEGSKQLGLGKWAIVLWCLKFFHFFALGCGLVFAVIIWTQRSYIQTLYSDDTEYAGFLDLVDSAWPLFVIVQPIYALVAVMGPLLMTTQNFVYWGKAVAICFFGVFVPVVAYAAAVGSTYHVILADVLYNAAHLVLLLWKVTYLEMRKIGAKAAEEVPTEDQNDTALGPV